MFCYSFQRKHFVLLFYKHSHGKKLFSNSRKNKVFVNCRWPCRKQTTNMRMEQKEMKLERKLTNQKGRHLWSEPCNQRSIWCLVLQSLHRSDSGQLQVSLHQSMATGIEKILLFLKIFFTFSVFFVAFLYVLFCIIWKMVQYSIIIQSLSWIIPRWKPLKGR